MNGLKLCIYKRQCIQLTNNINTIESSTNPLPPDVAKKPKQNTNPKETREKKEDKAKGKKDKVKGKKEKAKEDKKKGTHVVVRIFGVKI